MSENSNQPLEAPASREPPAAILTAPSAEKEYELKSHGLRNVENALWAVANTDFHQALSYDRLHVDIIGMFQKHILSEIKTKLKHLG
ncbi:hypothetical protein BC835DRAFT_1417252 [Cytidiella melzeri]|nr:hypothetical protein BC835DRAFT_1424802 [Cytidiella melzeri]KAI0691225.1 hypothetical protein BC835DRAFT_1417252 [Cytidiella melzeri]